VAGLVLGSSFQISHSLQERLKELLEKQLDAFAQWVDEDTFEGELTEIEWSESEDDQSSPEAPAQVVDAPGIRKLYEKARQKARQKEKRALEEAKRLELDPSIVLKPTLLRHRARAAHIIVDYSMATQAEVTAPGWVGKNQKHFPQGPISLGELQKNYKGLKVFPWNGR
jgi:hypothetical protein